MGDRLYCENCDAIPTRVTRIAVVEGGHVAVDLCSACLANVVLTDPDAVWAVLTSGVKVAGPWERVEHASRRQTQGWDRASANECASPAGTWLGWVDKSPSQGGFTSRGAAEAWCDDQLRKDGYMLVNGEVQGG